MGTLHKQETVLLTGNVTEVMEPYPELDGDGLRVQLQMLLSKHMIKSSSDAAVILRGMSVEVRGLFDQVEALVRLLLVVPVSSTEAERSFNALRRLKTWLRSTVSQECLNHAAVCHVHRDMIDKLDLKAICRQCVSITERRRHVFESYT